MLTPISYLLFIFLTKTKKKVHEPSYYRQLLREMKSKESRHIELLIEDARSLTDAYYVSLALCSLSTDKRLSLKRAFAVADESLLISSDVPRLWRRAELLTILAKKISRWRADDADEEKKILLDKLLKIILSMPDGKELLESIKGCISRFECSHLKQLINRSLTNDGFELLSSKIVIRYLAQKCNSTKDIKDVIKTLTSIENNILKAKLIGYFILQIHKREQHTNYTPYIIELLKQSIQATLTLDKEIRLDLFEYLVKISESPEEFNYLYSVLNNFDDLNEKTKVLISLGNQMHNAGLINESKALLNEAWQLSEFINNPLSRAKIRYNIAEYFLKNKNIEIAQKVFNGALEDGKDNDEFLVKLNNLAKQYEIALPNLFIEKNQKRLTKPHIENGYEKDKEQIMNHSIALYNTYQGAIGHVQLRAIARAVPLCIAFDLNLVLIGFTSSLDELKKKVLTNTNIGNITNYFNILLKQKRIELIKSDYAKIPESWEKIGLPIATTSKPNLKKQKDIKEVINIAISQHPTQKVCMIMGLGKKGLPLTFLKSAPYHLELTTKKISLETCTVMGIIAQQLHYAITSEYD